MASRFVILLLLLFCSTSSIMGARTRTISALELLASARVLQNAIGNMDGWTATIQQNEVMPGKPEHFAGLKVSMDDELLSENTNFGRGETFFCCFFLYFLSCDIFVSLFCIWLDNAR